MWKKKLKFYEAAKSYISALCEKKLSTVVRCLWRLTCITLHSFFPHPPLCLVNKKTCLIIIYLTQTVISLSTMLIWWKNSLPTPPLNFQLDYSQLQSILHNIFFTGNWRDINNLVFNTVFKNQPWYRMISRETSTWLDSSIIK